MRLIYSMRHNSHMQSDGNSYEREYTTHTSKVIRTHTSDRAYTTHTCKVIARLDRET